MTVKLVTVDAVIQRMSLGDHEDILNSVESALVGVAELLQSKIDTVFDPVVNKVEVFRPRVKKFWDTTPDDLLRLKLRNAFVTSGSVELKFGNALPDVINHTGTVVPTSDYTVDFERGYIYLALDYDDQYVSVKYSAGIQFPAGTPPPDVTDVPAWLQEAALAYVPVVLNQNQTTNRSPEMENTLKLLTAHASAIVDPHVRNIPFAHTPIL